MSDKYTFTLRDGEKTCKMSFLTLKYLEGYFKNIDITKVKVHNIMNGKLYFIYDENHYESCPFITAEDFLRIYMPALIDTKAFIVVILGLISIGQIMEK